MLLLLLLPISACSQFEDCTVEYHLPRLLPVVVQLFMKRCCCCCTCSCSDLCWHMCAVYAHPMLARYATT